MSILYLAFKLLPYFSVQPTIPDIPTNTHKLENKIWSTPIPNVHNARVI